MATKDSATSQEVPPPLSPRLLSLKKVLCALAIGFFLFYAAGISVRSRQGIRVVVQNESGTSLNNANVTLDKGGSYPLGEIAAGKTKKVFVLPGGASSIRLDFVDPNARHHSDIVAGYVEDGYCGEVRAQVLPNLGVKSRDDSFAMWNWESWYGFL